MRSSLGTSTWRLLQTQIPRDAQLPGGRRARHPGPVSVASRRRGWGLHPSPDQRSKSRRCHMTDSSARCGRKKLARAPRRAQAAAKCGSKVVAWTWSGATCGPATRAGWVVPQLWQTVHTEEGARLWNTNSPVMWNNTDRLSFTWSFTNSSAY